MKLLRENGVNGISWGRQERTQKLRLPDTRMISVRGRTVNRTQELSGFVMAMASLGMEDRSFDD